MDCRYFKNLRFSENMNVQFRTESFNLSNTPQSGLRSQCVWLFKRRYAAGWPISDILPPPIKTAVKPNPNCSSSSY